MILENLQDPTRYWHSAYHFFSWMFNLHVRRFLGLKIFVVLDPGSIQCPCHRKVTPSNLALSSPFSSQLDPHLNAPFEHVARGEGSLPEQFTEDDDLLEEEHSPLLGPGLHACVQLNHVERVLLQQLPLSGQGALVERRAGVKQLKNKEPALAFWVHRSPPLQTWTADPISKASGLY